MYAPVLIAAPALPPVSLAEAKAYLRVPYADKDAVITALIDAATSLLDGWTGSLGRCLVEQTWSQSYDAMTRVLRLPLFPVIAVQSVKFLDGQSVEQTVDTANYMLMRDDRGGYVRFVDGYAFPAVAASPATVTVMYVAGYENGGTEQAPISTVPAAIQTAINMMVEHWFYPKEDKTFGVDLSEVPPGAQMLLAPFRRVKL